MTQLEEENSQVNKLRSRVVDLENKLSQESSNHRESLQDRDRSLERLRNNLRRSEEEIDKIRDEELKRAAVLQQAVLSYVNDVQSTRSSVARLPS